MNSREQMEKLLEPIGEDLTSGAADLALQGVMVFRMLVAESGDQPPEQLKQALVETGRRLVHGQPAMAPLFNLANSVLSATKDIESSEKLVQVCEATLDQFETRLCESAARIADLVYDLIPAGELIYAHSFSSTVVSSLLNARNQRKFFRAVCTEARPSLEGRKAASMLAAAGMEVLYTFDSAMGLILPECSVAFMGCDSVSRPGIVNKVGSWLLALACREIGIPLYALAGTEKFVDEERMFAFEDDERPGSEVWDEPPKGVRVLNRQYELIPYSWLSGLITERGILQEADVDQLVSELDVHEALKLEPAAPK
jgi:translation initiation factor eIF-2B subunit delta